MTSLRAAFRARLGTIAFTLVLLLGAFVLRRRLLAWFGHVEAKAPSAPASSASAAVHHYTCPMHPSVQKSGPGQCPICGMDLVAVTHEQATQSEVVIDAARRQLIGVRGEIVNEAPFARTLRAVGQVAYDESTLSDVTLKVGGFVSKLFVNRTGQRVSRGEPLFSLYSPELYGAQQDFLLATTRPETLGRATRQRLHLLGMSENQIDALTKSGVASESVTFPSPKTGFVIEKNVVEGASVEAGARLYRIAALERVWVEAEVYEADLAQVHVGQSANVTLDYLPGRSYRAKLTSVYPYLDVQARTARVRVELANRELELRPGMYATVELVADSAPRLQVPTAAVVYTGPRRLVFVDLGEGRYRPTEIRIGAEANGKYEVLSGLSKGDVVATSGVFLIAAEARISTAAKYWDTPESDAGSPAP